MKAYDAPVLIALDDALRAVYWFKADLKSMLTRAGVPEQIVRQRARDRNVLQPDGNRIGLGGPNPDGQIAIRVLLPKDDHPLVVHEAEADALDAELFHEHHLLTFTLAR